MARGQKRQAATARQQIGRPSGRRTRQTTAAVMKAGGGASVAFSDLVTLVHSHLAPLLLPQDANSLLLSCSRSLEQETRDAIATKALLSYFEKDSVHFGLKCVGDWHQLLPQSTQRATAGCTCNWDAIAGIWVVPSELPLPKIFDARAYLLEAMCLLYKGIYHHCFKVLLMFSGLGYFTPATMQPIVFSLAEGLEKERGVDSNLAGDTIPINTEDTKELARLLDIVEPGFDVEFFSSRNARRSPAYILEAHWRGTTVDLESGSTNCELCKHYKKSQLFHHDRGPPRAHSCRHLRAHCSAVYQPLKKFMLQHLKHVRYIQPPRGWNYEHNRERGLLRLIAGFTSAGVLCGVYVTDIGISQEMISSRLAPGHDGQ
ncbi:unnamed protein product [Phytophthora fragariaefolia]|uniref:Unnamed protein product n=1 Tax=Phytophthora fragariaefolia TaxID=1490495 RepID=A0A9W6TVQ3_9STRA|nr:unnamed protein product [Phytophthora fragariaefolia]